MNTPKTNQSTLTERQKKALPYFIASTSETEACKRANIAKWTYYEWLKEPAFKSELFRLRELVVEEAVQTLTGHISKAAGALVELLDTPNPALKRSVANDIISHVLKIKELHEMQARIQALEEKVAANKE